MKVAIINYGLGNLLSVKRASEDLGVDAFIATKPDQLNNAEKIILPGVGSFAQGVSKLKELNFFDAILNEVLVKKKPILGICLGMQILATSGNEGGLTKGLSLIEGNVKRLDNLGCHLKVPHIGWNNLNISRESIIFKDIPNNTDFYFVHSYAFDVKNKNWVLGLSNYDINFPVVINKEHIYGCQFHPEKSSKYGRIFLKNFFNC